MLNYSKPLILLFWVFRSVFLRQALDTSYQVVFRTMLKEMAAREEQDKDIDVPLTANLETETRRKLGVL